MRVIKFRLRDRETKKVIGYEVLVDGQWMHSTHNFSFKPGVFDVVADREQYTGRPDTEGREIYENDLVEYWHYPGAIKTRRSKVVRWQERSERHKWVGFNVQGSKFVRVVGDMYGNSLTDVEEGL